MPILYLDLGVLDAQMGPAETCSARFAIVLKHAMGARQSIICWHAGPDL